MLALRNSGVSADALTTGVCGFIYAEKSGQKVYLNGASFWTIFGFSGLELPLDAEATPDAIEALYSDVTVQNIINSITITAA
jgi:hypothetical protein